METFSPNLEKGLWACFWLVQRPVSFTKNDLDHPLLTACSSYCIIRELFNFNKLVFKMYILILKKKIVSTVKILLKVPLSNTRMQDFDTSAIVLYMNYAKHRFFFYQTVKLSKITSSFYANIFTFTRFAATRFKIKQCYKPKLLKKNQ